jgi:hypothetical protein
VIIPALLAWRLFPEAWQTEHRRRRRKEGKKENATKGGVAAGLRPLGFADNFFDSKEEWTTISGWLGTGIRQIPTFLVGQAIVSEIPMKPKS